MAHWLEEAEREEMRKQQRLSKNSAKIQDKIFRIRQNYEANKELYEQFLEVMHDFCQRANSLPAEKENPGNRLSSKPKNRNLKIICI